MQIKNRQQLLIIAAIVAIALFAGDELVVTPVMKIWSARAARVAELRKQLDRGKGLVEREQRQSIRSRWQGE